VSNKKYLPKEEFFLKNTLTFRREAFIIRIAERRNIYGNDVKTTSTRKRLDAGRTGAKD